MRKIVVLFTFWLCAAGSALPQTTKTRGVGIYPGRQSERFAPRPTTDSTYRNLALLKKAWASSSIDLSHTAQLVTDGTQDHSPVAWLEVLTNSGPVPRHAREWTIDGSRYSEWMLNGPQAYIEYRWHNHPISLGGIHITGRLAHNEEAHGGYSIVVSGSTDGKTWHTLATENADSLPGNPLKWRLHADPNKQNDNDLLPARNINSSLLFAEKVRITHLRISFKMKEAVYWMLWDTDLLQKDTHENYRPVPDANANSWFQSAWVSDMLSEQHLTVDLARVCYINKVYLHWIEPAADGEVLTSADGKHWHRMGRFRNNTDTLQTLTGRAKARFVRLDLTRSGPQQRYALTEMEVWGTGGSSFLPAERPPATSDRLPLWGGAWTLRRADSQQTITATVPGTVLTSYANVMAVSDCNHGDSLLQVSDAYFNAAFEYETMFDVPSDWLQMGATLCLDGINPRADIWLNGELLGQTEGAFCRHRLDTTPLLRASDNHLRIKVYPPLHPGPTKERTQQTTGTNGGRLTQDAPTYLATTGWDWIPTVRGRDMGIYDNLYLERNHNARLSDPYVETTVGSDTLCTITPKVMVENCTDSERSLLIRGTIGPITFEKHLTLPPRSQHEATFSPDIHRQLSQQALPLWWPNDMGAPFLHHATYALYEQGTRIDTLTYSVGLRQVTYTDADKALKIYVNNRRLVPMGGNWGFSEVNLNYRKREYEAAIAYHSDQHFNMIRNWVGQTADESFFESCDRNGLMVWQDFWLANPSDGPDPSDESLFATCAEDFVKRVRRHPSVVLYCGRNEGRPTDTLDGILRHTIDSLSPQLHYISDSADGGVSGHGPYKNLEEKEYFALQTGRLHTERGMPCIPTPESMQRMFGGEDRWPQDHLWGQHDFTLQGAQGGKSYNERLEALFGQPQSMKQFARWAQIVNYNGYRAMFESSLQERQGLLIWMSHPCWPSMVWQTYDYYLQPTAAYFGAKKACEPLHLMLNSLTGEVQLVNRSQQPAEQLYCSARIVDTAGRPLGHQWLRTNCPTDSTLTLFTAPKPATDCGTYYLLLHAEDPQGNHLAENCYMLTTNGHHKDLLQQTTPLPACKWSVAWQDDETTTLNVLLTNYGKQVVPYLRVILADESGQEILPAIYSDNYLTLLPRQTRHISIQFRNEDLHGSNFEIKVQKTVSTTL